MAKKMKKLMGLGLALVLSVAPLAAPALAEEEAAAPASAVEFTTEVPVSTGANKEEAVEVKVTTEVTENADGTKDIHIDVSAEDYKTKNNNEVDLNGSYDMVEDENGVVTGEGSMEYRATNPSGNMGADGGSEWVVEENTSELEGAEVDVPLTEGETNSVVGREEGTVIEVSGDVKENPGDGEYDYTTSTVVKQGSVDVTTEEIIIIDKVAEGTEMEYVNSETVPDENNDLGYVAAAPEEYLPGYEGKAETPEGVEGYDYVYVGSGNTSKYVPAIVFTEPLSNEQKLEQYGENAYIKNNSITWYYVKWLKEEAKANIAYDENGKYVTDAEGYILDVNGDRIFKEERTATDPDGNTTYLHRFDNYNNSLNVEGWFEDGEWVKELNGADAYTGIWAGPQQFLLVDGEGNIITTYCADFTTPTQDLFGYNVENLEDATYYSDEDAEQIRSIALNGYWGTTGAGEVGSLDYMKASLLASGLFTEEELEKLNDGVALTATQMAIWSCSNRMSSLEFINAHYSNWGTGNVPTDKEDEVKLMFKLYDYLMKLEPTEVEKTTSNTIINADNFVKDLGITVIEKADGHENNKDKAKDNDAYVTNLSFALVVAPSTENGDDLVVKVVDAQGNELAKGRIAGNLKDGEKQLVADSEGNYMFEGITLIEGEQNFNLTLEGIQHLAEGVYLYSSEVQDGTSSQTLVGLASGDRGVSVSMNIKFDVNVQDEVVATERVWRDEWTRNNPPAGFNPPPAINPPVVINDDPVPLGDDGLVTILDEEVPLADAPQTGDNSIVYVLMSLISLCGIVLLAKKRSVA